MYDKIMISLLVILLGVDFIITNKTMMDMRKEIDELKRSVFNGDSDN